MMKYLRHTFLLLTALNVLAARGQVNSLVQKAYAYRTVSAPGNIKKDDDNGAAVQNEMNIRYTLLVETKGIPPKWHSVVISGKTFVPTVTAVKERSLYVGLRKVGEKKVFVTPKPGNKLWQLDVEYSSANLGGEEEFQLIKLRGTYNRKPLSYKIRGVIDLKSPEYY